jgi:hypothetical protein
VKAGKQGDFRHRVIGLVEQAFGALNAGGLSHLGWRRTETLREQSGEVSPSYATAPAEASSYR